jgi:type II secretory pathway pseudopilin PulG
VTRSGRGSGLSLLECTTALAVVTVVAGAALLVGPAHSRTVARAQRETVAYAVASSALEQSSAWLGQAAPAAGADVPFALDGPAAWWLPGARALRRAGAPQDGLVRVEVELRWPEPGGEAVVRLATLVAVGEERP